MAIGRLQAELERKKGISPGGPVLVDEDGGAEAAGATIGGDSAEGTVEGGGGGGGAGTFLTEAGLAGGARG